jgi:hypothetical protein
MAAHLLAENFGHVERRRRELQRMREGLGPAHVAEIFQVPPLADALNQFGGALPAFFQPLGPFSLGFEQRGKGSDFVFQRLQRVFEFGLFFQLTVGEAASVEADGQTQVLGGFFDALAGNGQGQAIAGGSQCFGAGVSGQIDDLGGRYGVAEEQRRHFRQLVGFVEDDRVAGRQQFGHALVAEHDVGEEKMVIDDDEVGRHRLAPRLHDEAFLVVRAFLAEAVVARRGGVAPHRGILGNLDTFSLVAGLRGLGEDRDAACVGRIFAGQETTVGDGVLQVIRADVVGPALQQRDLDRRFQASRTIGKSLLNNWSCKVLVPVDTMTLPPDCKAGTR